MAGGAARPRAVRSRAARSSPVGHGWGSTTAPFGQRARPWAWRIGAPGDLDEPVGRDGLPWTDLSVRPGHPDLGPGGRSETDVDRAERPARVPAADGDLASLDQPVRAELDPGAGGIAVGPRLDAQDPGPVAH